MEISGCIERNGIVTAKENGLITVRISKMSACSDCHAKGSCAVFGLDEKPIDIMISGEEGDYRVGEDVIISMSQSTGVKAVLLGYFLPFLFVIACIIIFSILNFKEWQVGVFSLMVLLPYYLGLYLFRSKFGKSFKFILKKK